MRSLETCRLNIMVSNMEVSLQFYTETLALQLVGSYGENYAEFQAPDMLIGLHPRSPLVITGNNMPIGFGVTEFDLEVRELEEKGIHVEIEIDGWIRLAHFQDPCGNNLFLAERK